MLITFWHQLLGMKKYDLQWHQEDIQDEYNEYLEAKGVISKWSELSDVAYTYSRSKWSGHRVESPIGLLGRIVGYFYMIPKYSLRFIFFRRAGKKVDNSVKIHEVRNPAKVHKLETVAKRNNLDVEAFIEQCTKQLSYWPLLK